MGWNQESASCFHLQRNGLPVANVLLHEFPEQIGEWRIGLLMLAQAARKLESLRDKAIHVPDFVVETADLLFRRIGRKQRQFQLHAREWRAQVVGNTREQGRAVFQQDLDFALGTVDPVREDREFPWPALLERLVMPRLADLFHGPGQPCERARDVQCEQQCREEDDQHAGGQDENDGDGQLVLQPFAGKTDAHNLPAEIDVSPYPVGVLDAGPESDPLARFL